MGGNLSKTVGRLVWAVETVTALSNAVLRGHGFELPSDFAVIV